MRTCPECGEQWATRTSVCPGCSAILHQGRDRGAVRWRRWVVIGAAAGVVAAGVVVGVVALAAGWGDGAGDVGIPPGAREARPDELPDLRTRPDIACQVGGEATDCARWVFTLPEDIGTADAALAVATTDDGLVVIRTPSNLHAVDPENGELAWSRELPGPRDVLPPAVVDGHLVLVEGDHEFQVRSAQSGRLVREHVTDGRILDSLVDGPDLVLVLQDATSPADVWVEAWRPTDLEPRWVGRPPADWRLPLEVAPDYWRLPSFRIVDLRAGDSLVVLGGAGPDAPGVAFDRETGELRDVPADPRDWVDTSAEQSGIVVELMGTVIQAWHHTDGVLWEHPLSSPWVWPTLLEGGWVAITRQDAGGVTLLDAATGEDRARIDFGRSRVSVLTRETPWLVRVNTVDAQHVVRIDLPPR